jgi:DNA-directed RNA polymerase specialized sigma24 family protein
MPTTQAETRPPPPPMALIVGRLPSRHREILLATYFRGQTVGEAAHALGLDPAEAKIRLYQAMRGLAGMVAVADTAVSGRPARAFGRDG